MGARIPTPQDPHSRGQPVDPSPDPGPCRAPKASTGTTLNIGPILVRTIAHFFPELNTWIDQIHDPRWLPLVVDVATHGGRIRWRGENEGFSLMTARHDVSLAAWLDRRDRNESSLPQVIHLVLGCFNSSDFAEIVRPINQRLERVVGEGSEQLDSDLAFTEQGLTNRDDDSFHTVARRVTLRKQPDRLPFLPARESPRFDHTTI